MNLTNNTLKYTEILKNERFLYTNLLFLGRIITNYFTFSTISL